MISRFRMALARGQSRFARSSVRCLATCKGQRPAVVCAMLEGTSLASSSAAWLDINRLRSRSATMSRETCRSPAAGIALVRQQADPFGGIRMVPRSGRPTTAVTKAAARTDANSCARISAAAPGFSAKCSITAAQDTYRPKHTNLARLTGFHANRHRRRNPQAHMRPGTQRAQLPSQGQCQRPRVAVRGSKLLLGAGGYSRIDDVNIFVG